jgi:hypothetical protein
MTEGRGRIHAHESEGAASASTGSFKNEVHSFPMHEQFLEFFTIDLVELPLKQPPFRAGIECHHIE